MSVSSSHAGVFALNAGYDSQWIAVVPGEKVDWRAGLTGFDAGFTEELTRAVWYEVSWQLPVTMDAVQFAPWFRKSRRHGMVPAQITVFLSQKPSTKNGIIRRCHIAGEVRNTS